MPLKRNRDIESGKKPKQLGLKDVRVVSHSYHTWLVELFWRVEDVSEEILSQRLQQVKEAIVSRYDLPSYSIRYKELVDKEITAGGVLTRVKLERVTLDKGRPKFSFKSALSPRGIPYNEMVCYAELYMLDEFENEITEDRLINYLKHEGVVEDFIDREAVTEAIKEIYKKRAPLYGVRLAQGNFPDAGRDAEVEFYFAAQPSMDNIEEYISSRKAGRGDILCTMTPPSDGKSEGITVKGRKIPPGKGLKIIIEAGKNVHASGDGNTLYADLEGLVVIRREERSFMTPAGEKIIPSKIAVRIDPMLVIEATDETIDITTRESVEIKGKLKMGSRIVSSGEIHIEGDVGENSTILATDDIVVSGIVKNVTLASNRNIIAKSEIEGGDVSASESVIAKQITGAKVSGKRIIADKIMGGEINAGEQVSVDELGADEDGITATICVGMQDFLEKKIKENSDFIVEARKNLSKMVQLFGEDIVNEVFPQNVQQMLLKFTTMLKKTQGLKSLPQSKVESYKRLLTSIEPLRRIVKDKEVESIRLRRKMRSAGKEKKMIVVKERVTAKTKVVMEGKTRQLAPSQGKVEVYEDDELLFPMDEDNGEQK